MARTNLLAQALMELLFSDCNSSYPTSYEYSPEVLIILKPALRIPVIKIILRAHVLIGSVRDPVSRGSEQSLKIPSWQVSYYQGKYSNYSVAYNQLF